MKAASYGIVDFKTITNKSLSIQARAIYCYLSCYANKNHTAFPCRERILKELGISKNGYYKHYHQAVKITSIIYFSESWHIHRSSALRTRIL